MTSKTAKTAKTETPAASKPGITDERRDLLTQKILATTPICNALMAKIRECLKRAGKMPTVAGRAVVIEAAKATCPKVLGAWERYTAKIEAYKAELKAADLKIRISAAAKLERAAATMRESALVTLDIE